MRILGIESSCDETAAAVLSSEPRILSNVVSAQVEIHNRYGGVVPELASREHLKNIRPVVDRALEQADITLSSIDAVAVTQGPGLIGSLLVGLCYAKAVAFALDIPVIGINHLEGHIFAVELEHGPFPYPALILIVSGGHSSIFFSERPEEYRLVGQTRDDAAGEAFDKVAKLLGLGYPGGPIIDQLAEQGDREAFPFSIPRISDGSLDLSFSGIKSAVARTVRKHSIPVVEHGSAEVPSSVRDLLASFQQTVVMTLVDRAKRASACLSPKSIVLSGGVACNRSLRDTFAAYFEPMGIRVLFPRPALTTDNAAMVAAAAIPKVLRGQCSSYDVNAFANLPLTTDRVNLPNRLINN